MYERLLKLYKNKIIESPQEFNPSEYYYYKTNEHNYIIIVNVVERLWKQNKLSSEYKAISSMLQCTN